MFRMSRYPGPDRTFIFRVRLALSFVQRPSITLLTLLQKSTCHKTILMTGHISIDIQSSLCLASAKLNFRTASAGERVERTVQRFHNLFV